VWTVVLAAAAVVAAAAGDRWLLVAAIAVVACGLADSLDGGVAVMTDRATPWGYVLDSVVDRVTDVLFLVAIILAGAPVALGVGCGAGILLLEYLRARGGNAGAGEIGAVTVGERANRVVFGAATLGVAGVYPVAAGGIATAGLGILTALTAVGCGQLVVAVHRRLSA
jgi:CDP-diacylglycerol--glycerol-3-phosphate 3-phosphatidyltransferase